MPPARLRDLARAARVHPGAWAPAGAASGC